MIIRIKYYLATFIEIVVFVIAANAFMIWYKFDYIASHPKIIPLIILFPAPIMLLCLYISFVYVFINEDNIFKRNFIKKQVINKENIEKIIVVLYEHNNKIEQIRIYQKNNSVDHPAMIIGSKQYNIKKAYDALVKYDYNLTIEYL